MLKTYQSDQPLTVEYYSRKKFDHLYVNILPNLNYAVNSNVLIGLQSGMYAHFEERYSGYRLPVFITVPVMATGRINIANIKSHKLGINVAGGRNFFHMNTYPDDIKNGWLFNASVFYHSNKRSVFKLGVERRVENGYHYYTSDNSWTKDETYKYKLSRLSIVLSYGFVIKQF